MISMDCVRHTAFKLSRVPYLSPIQGTVHMTLRCTMEANVVFKGFIVSQTAMEYILLREHHYCYMISPEHRHIITLIYLWLLYAELLYAYGPEEQN